VRPEGRCWVLQKNNRVSLRKPTPITEDFCANERGKGGGRREEEDDELFGKKKVCSNE
jgi:hypothetical protein